MMFVGGVVLMLDRILVLFLPLKIYGSVVFRSRPNPYSGKAVKKTQHIRKICTESILAS
jgi:hypothetical protein